MDGMNDMDFNAPPTPAAPTPTLEQCVPLASLGVPGESEQMETPEIGDTVDYSVQGKVTRIDGDKAYIQAEAINGQPVENKPQAEAPDEMAGLEQMAGELDTLT